MLFIVYNIYVINRLIFFQVIDHPIEVLGQWKWVTLRRECSGAGKCKVPSLPGGYFMLADPLDFLD